MKSTVEQSVVQRVDDADKEKKKKRRSNRRSKQNPASSASSNVPACFSSSSSKQQVFNMHSLNEQGLSRASDGAFNYMPPMHINEQLDTSEGQTMQMYGQEMFSNSSPHPIVCGRSLGTSTDKYSLPYHQMVVCGQRNYFIPHWSTDAVEKALEKGDVFKALFRVNAYNRLEAYCKIDGVPTDVLISGIPAQNRAVEGDIVAITVDPLTSWTRMKGSNGVSDNSSPVEDCNSFLVNDEMAGDSCKGNDKVDHGHEDHLYRNFPIPGRGCCFAESTSHGATYGLDSTRLAGHSGPNGHYPSTSDSLHIGSCIGQSEVLNALDKLRSMINSFPSKGPTGRVVAVIERSRRRDAVVGYLNVKQWISYRNFNKKEGMKIKSLAAEQEYIQLIPNDRKFMKMMVLVRDLPNYIKKRLWNEDLTVERDLVAAQIDNWPEDCHVPQAHILHIFGRGSEVEPHIDAILFENAICSEEFSLEALSCLPHLPWEVPPEEFRSRIDLRNLCVFTIDPSTATDLDDALSIEKLPNENFRVGIHIADVTYFVLPDTALDIEAQLRSTSVSMSQQKLSMLPASLSENVGSLNPGVDRLVFSIFLDIDHAGNVVDRWIGRAVMQSCCKLSYDHAQDIIDGVIDVETSNFSDNCYPQLHGNFEWSDVVRSVNCLYKISKMLKEKRFSDGALRLEGSKVVFLFDEYGNPYDSMLCDQKESNFLVEEFMLLANRTAAEVICRAFPDSALLRRHPEPNMRKLIEFEAFCLKHGLELDTSSSGQFHQSLERIREKLKGDSVLFDILISYATRPMQLASYFCTRDLKDNENEWGHYALALPLYTHFTSPLRQYPDIVVHRTLAAAMEAEKLYQNKLQVNSGEEVRKSFFTGVYFDKSAAESLDGKEALLAAALKNKVPGTELLADVAAYCNERKLASRRVKDACDKLYMWVLLKKKEVILSEARIMGLGPRFMSIYIQKLAIERRINYDEVEDLTVEWLDATTTLVLSLYANKPGFRKGSAGKLRALEDVALVVSPYEVSQVTLEKDGLDEFGATNAGDAGVAALDKESSTKFDISDNEINPAVFPFTVRVLSTIPVALHAVGGDDGPLDIGVRLYMTSYCR
ncbi:DIS3-like exonuclease 2 [Quillaja saponaria]|uniref:DIS3-like exonuclease 2 n=1 Tax=Quillaja saponaria TaxID=32244 RepID=A0AAD7LJI0_QUISA|nr:DIS3-like exonuclease 2 [Quillaja saponaria]